MKQKYYFLSAVAVSMLMLSACTTDDGTTDAVASTDQGSPLIVSVSPGDISASYTRAESNVQESQFNTNEEIDVFLKDASEEPYTGGSVTNYTYPLVYKTVSSSGTMYLKTYTDGETPEENRLFWPKLMHPLYIFGIYPKGSVSSSTKIGDAYAPFDSTKTYTFTVKPDQTEVGNYKLSDLMTGLPTGYSNRVNTTPYYLKQLENPSNIPLLFTHRLTKIMVNVTKTIDTQDADISINDLKYSGDTDDKWAVITLLNVKRTTTFQVRSNDVLVDDDASFVGGDIADRTVIVGKGNTEKTINVSGQNYKAVSLSAIIPPQVIPASTTFIKVELIDKVNGEEANGFITDTFLYSTGITFDATKVYTYNIRINKPYISVTTSITPWTVVDPINNIGIWQ